MSEQTPDISVETLLRQLTEQATARFGADYAQNNQALLRQAAEYAANVANNLPDAETEPGFHQV